VNVGSNCAALSEDFVNAFNEVRAKSELVSNEVDDSDLQDQNDSEQRI
jgi:hypothetical protein